MTKKYSRIASGVFFDKSMISTHCEEGVVRALHEVEPR